MPHLPFDTPQRSEISLHTRSKQETQPPPSSKSFTHYPPQPVAFSSCHDITHELDQLKAHGRVTAFEATSTLLLIGFSSGTLVAFDYRQTKLFTLTPLQGNSEVSSICVSPDEEMMAIGYSNGFILLWEVGSAPKQPQPWHVIRPTTIKNRFSKGVSAHLSGVCIQKVQFLSNSHVQLLSADNSGLVFYHHLVRTSYSTLFSNEHQYPTISTKIWGTNDANREEGQKVLDMAVLPLGSSHEVTDDVGVVAILTPMKMAVISVLSLNMPTKALVRKLWSVGRREPAVSGTVDWFPCMKQSNGELSNSRLCYTWNNTVTIAEINNRMIPPNWLSVVSDVKDKDKAVPPIILTKTSKWKGPSNSIEFAKWINRDIMAVGTGNELRVLHYDETAVREVLHQNRLAENDQISVVCIRKQRLICFDGKVAIGSLLNWADWIGQLLSSSRYHDAFTSAIEFYQMENPGLITTFGLDFNAGNRRAALQPLLLQILSTDELSVPVNDVMRILGEMVSDDATLLGRIQDILEKWFERTDANAYFDALEPWISSAVIVQLPPHVLQSLVRHYVGIKEGVLLTELLCRLDLSTLDIDLTLQLAEKNNLHECSVYVWTTLLHDYRTPLFKFYSEGTGTAVFTYMSYILTGRQYPTDQFISSSDVEKMAKRAILEVIFAGHLLDSREVSAGIFPYLSRFLHMDCREMLRTLNAFFEDPSLNSGTFSRQYVVEALLDIFDSDKSFNDKERVQLAIFLGRNYPKYYQFLRLSDSVVTSVVNRLIGAGSGDFDVELALESLISVYRPVKPETLMSQLRQAKFYRVLMAIYRRQGFHGKAVEVWLLRGVSPEDSMATMLDSAFLATKSHPHQRQALVEEVISHFAELCAADMEGLVRVLSKYAPNLHSNVEKLPEEDQYKYLLLTKPVPKDLLSRFIGICSIYDPSSLYNLVKDNKSRVTKDEKLQMFLLDKHHYDAVVELWDLPWNEVIVMLQNSLGSGVFQQTLNIVMKKTKEIDEWLDIIKLLVSHADDNPAVTTAIHDCFRKLHNVQPHQYGDDSVFITVLQKFLGTSTEAQLSTIRGVLQEVVIGYGFEREISAISLKMLSSSISQDMSVVEGHLRGGKVVKCSDCTYCARPIWNRHDQYMAWERRQLDSLMESTTLVSKDDVVVVFECGHGYHDGCLIKLNGSQRRFCVVCKESEAQSRIEEI